LCLPSLVFQMYYVKTDESADILKPAELHAIKKVKDEIESMKEYLDLCVTYVADIFMWSH